MNGGVFAGVGGRQVRIIHNTASPVLE